MGPFSWVLFTSLSCPWVGSCASQDTPGAGSPASYPHTVISGLSTRGFLRAAEYLGSTCLSVWVDSRGFLEEVAVELGWGLWVGKRFCFAGDFFRGKVGPTGWQQWKLPHPLLPLTGLAFVLWWSRAPDGRLRGKIRGLGGGSRALRTGHCGWALHPNSTSGSLCHQEEVASPLWACVSSAERGKLLILGWPEEGTSVG